MIDHHALDEPHGGRTPSARAVNERRVASFFRDGCDELVGRRGIGIRGAKGNGIVADISGFRGRGFFFEVRPVLAGLAQIDD